MGTTGDGRAVAWNLVAGVHDDRAAASEPFGSRTSRTRSERPTSRTTCRRWPSTRDGGRDTLRFAAEATRERHDDLLVVRSDYVQPFGTFAGSLPYAGELAEGYGVMEHHDVVW